MNLPNKLTLLRILLIPVFIVLVTFPVLSAARLWAGVVFALASITDFLDGAIARKQGLETNFGKFTDPLADKMLTTVAFLYMMRDGVCDPLVLGIILAREFAVSGVRMLAASAPQAKVIAANMWGKIKTVFQMVTIIGYYVVGGILEATASSTPALQAQEVVLAAVISGLCWGVAALTAISGIQYLWGNRQFIDIKS